MQPIANSLGGTAQKTWRPSDIPQLEGRVFLVTGGHAGIGLETTRELARKGATVYIASRTASKVESAIEDISKDIPGVKERLHHIQLDLLSLQSCRDAAQAFKSKSQRLDCIVANAGVMAAPYKLSEDGIEQQFATNTLGAFAIIEPLIPMLQATAKQTGKKGRVVMLSSFAHQFISASPFGRPDFTSKKAINRSYGPSPAGPWLRYSVSKLADLLLARKLSTFEGITSVGVHPGFVASDLYKNSMMRVMLSRFISVPDGAISSLWAATSSDLDDKDLGGSYIVPFARVSQPTAYGKNDKLADDLWTLCDQLVKESTDASTSK